MDTPGADWLRLDQALQQALQAPESRRDELLNERLPDRPDLLAVARRALACDSALPSIGELAPKLIESLSDTNQRAEESRLTGHRLGPWKILHPIGRGGMGAVYLGQRADGVFERRVAIKLLPCALQSAELMARFERERNILASLSHASIAQLLDGGTMADGSPYLVLEYVDGESITAYCDRVALRLESRIRLIMEALAAVQFAHRNLVVHRDLKPANIMVDGNGHIKLLDFGIAKLMEEVGETGLTEPLGARLTPDYAAPEQLCGNRSNAASDVYALGCLSYRLLCGRVPLHLGGNSLTQMVDSLQSAERPSLSRLAARANLPPGMRRRDFSRDLDAIGLKAIQADPEQRYGTPAEFSADLQRLLDGLPVHARRVGRWYRTRKFITRHRAGFALTVGAFCILSLTTATALFQAEQAHRQRDEAQAITLVLRDLMQLADPDVGIGHQIDARSVLNTAMNKVITETGTRLETRIDLLEELADTLIAFELADDALRARQVIHALQMERFGADHPATLSALRAHAIALREQRQDFEQTRQMFQQVLEQRRRVLGERHPETAESYWDLGFLYLRYADAADPGRSERFALIEKAHDILRDTLGEDHLLTASALFDLGLATPDTELKVQRMRRSVEIRAQQVAADDLPLLQHQGDLAMVLSDGGHVEEGLAMGWLASEGYRSARGDLHPVSIILLNNLAGMYRDHGRYQEALDTYRRVDELIRAVVPEDHARRAYSQYGIGRTLNAMHRPTEAEPFLREAIRILELHQRHNLAGISRVELGDCLLAQQRQADAAHEYEQAVRIYTGQLKRNESDPQVSAIRQRLAAL